MVEFEHTPCVWLWREGLYCYMSCKAKPVIENGVWLHGYQMAFVDNEIRMYRYLTRKKSCYRLKIDDKEYFGCFKDEIQYNPHGFKSPYSSVMEVYFEISDVYEWN